jgi:hypothetical protein
MESDLSLKTYSNRRANNGIAIEMFAGVRTLELLARIHLNGETIPMAETISAADDLVSIVS